ncbi:hypothetical protein BH11CYA1_BH11CYA1_20190 [soil metagenome]
MNIALKQPTLLLISLVASTVHFMESARSQTAPSIKGQSIFAPYQPEPKFAPVRGSQPQADSVINSKENSSEQSSEPSDNPPSNQEPFTVTPDGVPALNIVPAVERPPIPPPPDAAPLRPNGNGIARPAQAWRVKAFQLFKQKVDPNTTIALLLNSDYDNALLAMRQAIEDEGLFVISISSSSGHMLISTTNFNILGNNDLRSTSTEKVIIAMRPALPEAKSKTEAKTELRVLCESRNKSLTTNRMNGILSKLQSKFGDIKTNAETL